MFRRVIPNVVLLAALSASTWAQGTVSDTTHSLTVATNANGKIHVASSASLTESGAPFGDSSASVSVQYYARTLTGGQITVQATSDFGACASPATSPSIACNTVQYSCGSASFGSACTTTTLSTSSATSVLALPSNSACVNGGNPCGPANPFTVPLNFTLNNDPNYKTGSYSATLQFTLSAT